MSKTFKPILAIALLALIGCNNQTAQSDTTNLADYIYYGVDIITMEGDSAQYVESGCNKGWKNIICWQQN